MLKRDILFVPAGDFSARDTMQSFTVCVMIGVSTDFSLVFFCFNLCTCVLSSFLFVHRVYDFPNNDDNNSCKLSRIRLE